MSPRPLFFCLSLSAAGLLGATGASATPATEAAAVSPRFTYTREDLLADLARALGEHYRTEGELQLEFLRAWTPPAPAAAPVSVLVLETPSSLSSTLLLRIRLMSGTESLGETAVLVRAQLLRDVWCTRTPVERGAAFDPALLDTRRVDTLRERDTLAASEDRAELTFSRGIPAGRLLTWRDVSRRALVRKGDVIEVAAVDGTLSISMKAMAMENGSAGETVRVRNLESRKEFSAVVVAESRAQVRF